MCKLTRFLIILVILSLGIPIFPATAAPPQLDVEINVNIDYSVYPYGGTFTATGPAVEAGLVCPSGYAVNVRHSDTGWQSSFAWSYHVWKQFICEDGSGTFIIKLEGRWEGLGGTGTWMILEGSGDYANLHGRGDAEAFFYEPWYGLDIYTGAMH
jgi:hypothetical protein